MQPATIMLALFLFFIGMLVLWLVIQVQGRWQYKMLGILVMPCMLFATWASLDSYLGWPTTKDTLPDRFVLAAGLIREPSLRSHDAGAIYLWVRAVEYPESRRSLLGYHQDLRDPRAYRLPYSRELHKELEGMLKKMHDGATVGGNNGTGTGRDGTQQGTGEPNLYVLPPSELSQKYH